MVSAPLSAAVLNDQALALLERGEVDEAEAAWLQALARDPLHFEATLNHSLSAWRRGRLTDEEVVARFEELHAARAGAWPAVLALGLVQLERRDLILAGRLLDKAARASDGAFDPEPLLRSATDGGVERLAELRVDRTPSFLLPLALAADASVLLVGEGHEIVLRRPQDLTELARVSGDSSSVTALVLTPDARLGLSGSDNGTLRLWDLSSRRLLRTLEGPSPGRVLSVAMSPDGRLVVSVSVEPGWAETQRRQAESAQKWLHENAGSSIRPGESTQVRVVHLWQLDSGQSRVLESGPEAAERVRQSADGERVVAVGSRPRAIDLVRGEITEIDPDQAVAWLAAGGPVREALRVPSSTPLDERFAMTGDGRRALWAMQFLGPDMQYRHTLRCHDLVSGRCLHTLSLEQSADEVQLSADGRVAITAQRASGLLRAWRFPGSWEPLVSLQASPPASSGPVRFAGTGAPELRAQAEEALAARDFHGGLERLSALRERPGHERTEETRNAWARLYRSCRRSSLRSTWLVRELEISLYELVRLAPDGSSLARTAGGKGSTVTLEEPGTGRPLQTLEGTVDRPGSLDYSTNMRFLAAGGYATVVVWDLTTGLQQLHRVRHFDSITGLRIAGDGRRARFTSSSGTRVWDGSEIPALGADPLAQWLERHERRIDLTADGRWQFEVAETPGPVYVVDRKEGSRRILVPGPVVSAEVARDGQWLVTVEQAGLHRRIVRVRFLDWDLVAAADADFDETARPLLEDFLSAHDPPGAGSADAGEWPQADFDQLMSTLGFAGLGWLRRDGVRRQILQMQR